MPFVICFRIDLGALVSRNFQTISMLRAAGRLTVCTELGCIFLGCEVCWREGLWEPYSPFFIPCNYVLCVDRERRVEVHFTRDRNNTSLQPNRTHVTSFLYIDTRAFKLLPWCRNTINSKNSTWAGPDNYVTGKILCVCVCVCVCVHFRSIRIRSVYRHSDVLVCPETLLEMIFRNFFQFCLHISRFSLQVIHRTLLLRRLYIRQYERVTRDQMRRVGWIFPEFILSSSIQDYFTETSETMHI
jgi:hypothetical protein